MVPQLSKYLSPILPTVKIMYKVPTSFQFIKLKNIFQMGINRESHKRLTATTYFLFKNFYLNFTIQLMNSLQSVAASSFYGSLKRRNFRT